ncbi:hypothetical protein D3C87_1462350 [compost metagenome]
MKAFVQALLVGLFLAQSAQAAVVRQVSGSSDEGKQLLKALELAPENLFACISSTTGGEVSDFKYRYSSIVSDLSGPSLNIIQYDSPTPLIQVTSRYGNQGEEIQFYTNASMTEVVQIRRKYFTRTQVNKGNLANPKIVFEDIANSTWSCKKIEAKKK